jgi:hypothetical protein
MKGTIPRAQEYEYSHTRFVTVQAPVFTRIYARGGEATLATLWHSCLRPASLDQEHNCENHA